MNGFWYYFFILYLWASSKPEESVVIFEMKPIALMHSPFKQKFGIPRQSGMIDIPGQIELLPPFDRSEAIKGLETCSHIWLTFVFHQNKSSTSVSVRPPRMGGNEKVGVFATRSSFRPNGMGLTLVKLEGISTEQGIQLHVSGIDLLDQTPILDIKPYLPYADCITSATNTLANDKPQKKYAVSWDASARDDFIRQAECSLYSEQQLSHWIEQLIALDPRPAYKAPDDKAIYWMQFDTVDVAWQLLDESRAVIVSVKPLSVT